MKIVINTLLIASVYSSLAIGHTVTVKNNQPIYDGAFDVSNEDFTSGIFGDDTGNGTIAIWTYNGNMLDTLSGMSRYSDELERGADLLEASEAEDVACPLNSDRTDNKAYLVVVESKIKSHNNSSGKTWYGNADIISGSDWNNNGKIDIFENLDGYLMSVSYPWSASETCFIKYR